MRLRGVITSSTVIASRSIRFASIVLCLPRKYCEPSSTIERSSSCVSWVPASGAARTRRIRSSTCTKRLTNQTTGCSTRSIGAST